MKRKPYSLIVLTIGVLVIFGCSGGSGESGGSAEDTVEKVASRSLTPSAAEPKAVTPSADQIFEEHEPFDPESYTGMMQSISTLGENTGSIALYVKKDVEGEFEKFGALEIKGKVVLGAEGVLGYADTFLRIQFLAEDDVWQELGRKAIKSGRLFVETKEKGELYTIYGLHPTQYTAIIEPGIQLPEAESGEEG
ncbi:MAG TPA: hypothetical protein VGG06_09605 [Thermoanaerobaculia bacterium]|jgi:hypothetical protein